MDFAILMDDVLKVTDVASDFIRSEAGKVQREQIEIKSRNSLVSYVDKQAETILVEGLGKLLPDAGFITEEGTVVQKTSEYTWVIDPLDGTTNFLHQIPVYSVSVGLLHEEQIILGVICDVEHRETFYAWKGGGAWCNGRQIHVSQQDNIEESLVATGFPYSSKDVLPQLTQVFAYFLKHARGIRRLGSAAIDLAYVACGRFDAYYENTLNPWDICAGIIIVEEAGGIVTDFAGGNEMLQNGQLIAAPATLHSSLADKIKSIYSS